MMSKFQRVVGQQRVVGLREKHRQKLNVYEHLYQGV
jgi:hypothetical protein